MAVSAKLLSKKRGQTAALCRFQESLKRLHDAQDNSRKFAERSRYIQSLRRQPFLDNYIKMNVALVLKFLVFFEGEAISSAPSKNEIPSFDVAFIVLQCD